MLNLSMRTLLPVKPLSLVTAVLLQRGVQRVSFIQMCTERLLWARAFSRHYRLADFFLTLAWNQHDYHLSFSLQNRQVTSDDELGYPGSNVPAVPSCLCPSELRWSSRWAQHTSEIPHWADLCKQREEDAKKVSAGLDDRYRWFIILKSVSRY